MEDDDFLLRQIKSIAEGFGYLAGKKGHEKTEIVYQQQQNQKGLLYTKLDDLLLHKKYEAAIHLVYEQKFELDRNSYYELGLWLIEKLKRDDSTMNPLLLQEFSTNMDKYKDKRTS
ncbi:DUF6483 family protein [Companilactobacillus halodurans]|uniref:Uncharacterized protein n=1 Tax=Companilactobacillus halodurans TaxID=2584183 RepID=A0A5P1A016_9LACO|nr:DUF6483 family protein [Companilactobacillus halodurans]MQS75881.1 hypothetical protein [Companilactobacillus halodurans]MQS98358.1 hypothetical protein [Companilactobacillus halodurans]